MEYCPPPAYIARIALLSTLIGMNLNVSTALGQSLWDTNIGIQQSSRYSPQHSPQYIPQRPASVSPFIRNEGLSQAELNRLRGFLRTAAYGENAPGAVRISATLLKAVTSDSNGNSRKAPPPSNEEDECFFQVPERFWQSKATTDKDPCTGLGTLLIADTATQILYLCKNGKTVKDYDFAKGWNGVGKRAEGDERTPLGVYSIKSPQKSVSGFHKFIHINYPTPLQKRQGYTGTNVGIHGPSRWARCLGRLNTAIFDWTNGCIAVGSDREIDEVSRFVAENEVTKLAVYPLEETGNSLEK